eukprot:SAG11_NODE_4252_length_1985_cov_1.644751_4_plen_103_part_01
MRLTHVVKPGLAAARADRIFAVAVDRELQVFARALFPTMCSAENKMSAACFCLVVEVVEVVVVLPLLSQPTLGDREAVRRGTLTPGASSPCVAFFVPLLGEKP